MISQLASFMLPLFSAGAQFEASGPVDLANVLEKRLAYVRTVTSILSRVAVERQAPTVTYFSRLLTVRVVMACWAVSLSKSMPSRSCPREMACLLAEPFE
jgi:hypothetical protein